MPGEAVAAISAGRRLTLNSGRENEPSFTLVPVPVKISWPRGPWRCRGRSRCRDRAATGHRVPRRSAARRAARSSSLRLERLGEDYHLIALALAVAMPEKVTISRLRRTRSKQEPMSKFPMTAKGRSALEDELKQRIRVERPHLVQRIQEAIADDSNLAENSEYHAAKTEQEINEARIAELEDKLARAEVIDVSKLFGDTIKFGATVTLIEEDTGEKKVWQIVGEPEADVKNGKFSVTSPIARALIGKTRGATVEVEAPGGAKVYKIRQVGWPEDSLRNREKS